MKLTQDKNGKYILNIQLKLDKETKDILQSDRLLRKYFPSDLTDENGETQETLNNKIEALLKFIINNKLYAKENLIQSIDEILEKEKQDKKEAKKEKEKEKEKEEQKEQEKIINANILTFKKMFIKYAYFSLRFVIDNYLITKYLSLTKGELSKEKADESMKASIDMTFNTLKGYYKDDEEILKIIDSLKDV